jgi:hypothetical protein
MLPNHLIFLPGPAPDNSTLLHSEITKASTAFIPFLVRINTLNIECRLDRRRHFIPGEETPRLRSIFGYFPSVRLLSAPAGNPSGKGTLNDRRKI